MTEEEDVYKILFGDDDFIDDEESEGFNNDLEQELFDDDEIFD